MEVDRVDEDGNVDLEIQSQLADDSGTIEEGESIFWRLATGPVWAVIFILGFFSGETYGIIRGVARVNPIKAVSNSQFFWAGALSVLVGFFVARRCYAACGNRGLSRDMGIVYTFLALVAFFPLPMLFVYSVLTDPYPLIVTLKKVPEVLMVGFAFKGAAFLYLSWRFALCIGLGRDSVFSMGMVEKVKTGGNKNKDAENENIEE